MISLNRVGLHYRYSIIFIVIVIITVPKPTLTEPLGIEIVRFGQKGAQRTQQGLTKETRGGCNWKLNMIKFTYGKCLNLKLSIQFK